MVFTIAPAGWSLLFLAMVCAFAYMAWCFRRVEAKLNESLVQKRVLQESLRAAKVREDKLILALGECQMKLGGKDDSGH